MTCVFPDLSQGIAERTAFCNLVSGNHFAAAHDLLCKASVPCRPLVLSATGNEHQAALAPACRCSRIVYVDFLAKKRCALIEEHL